MMMAAYPQTEPDVASNRLQEPCRTCLEQFGGDATRLRCLASTGRKITKSCGAEAASQQTRRDNLDFQKNDSLFK